MKAHRVDRGSWRCATTSRCGTCAPTRCGCASHTAGLCHSDVSVIDGTIPFPTPVVLGHEGAGVVEAGRRRRDQGEGRRPRRAHHARQLRPVRRLRPRPAHPLPRHASASCAARSPSAARRRSSSPTPACSPSRPSSTRPRRSSSTPTCRSRRLPHRLRGRHRRRRGAQPGQGRPRPVGRGHRRRRHRPQRHPGPARSRRACRSSRSTPTRRRRRSPASSAPPTSSTPAPTVDTVEAGQGDLPERRRLRLRVRRPPGPHPPGDRHCSTGAAARAARRAEARHRGAASSSTTSTTTSRSWAAATAPTRPHHDIPLLVELYKAGRLKLDELVSQVYAARRRSAGARRHARRQAQPRRARRRPDKEIHSHGVRRLRPAVRARSSSATSTRTAEHKRIMRNVEIAKAADRNGFKYVWCPQHHFLDEYSHMPGPEAFLVVLRRPDRAGPPRLGHLQHHAGGEQAGSGSPRTSPCSTTSPTTASSSAPAAARPRPRCSASTSTSVDETKAMWRRDDPRDPEDVEGRRRTATRASTSACPSARCSPSPTARCHPAMWVGGRQPRHLHRGRRAGPRRVLLRHRPPERDGAAGRRRTRTPSANATPGRRLRQRQHHGRDQHALHGGPQEGLRGRRRTWA